VSRNVSDFYDQYSEQQLKTGVHIRHYTILQRLKKSGLKSNHRVLEIGCGIGTLTGLLGTYLKDGELTAADISPESIEIARKRTAVLKHVNYVVTDMSDFVPKGKYDFIVFPDVLEHIPKEQHNSIFKLLSRAMHENSKVAIHIPDPLALDFIRTNTPELLQIIDQSLYLEDFGKAIEGTQLMVEIYERYPLFTIEPDYNWILLSVKRKYSAMPKQSKYKLKLVEWMRH
jgi:trans-aconitate 2-methyltransferase